MHSKRVSHALKGLLLANAFLLLVDDDREIKIVVHTANIAGIDANFCKATLVEIRCSYAIGNLCKQSLFLIASQLIG